MQKLNYPRLPLSFYCMWVKVTFCIFSHHGHAPHNARIIPSRLEMGCQKSILFAEMGKWYDKKVTQSRIVNEDCIIATSRVKMVYF